MPWSYLRNSEFRENNTISIIVIFILLNFCDHAFSHALKVQTMTPLELIQKSDFVVSVNIDARDGSPKASVIEVVKGLKGIPFPGEFKFSVFSARQSDEPLFHEGKKYIIFLSKGTNGQYSLMSYGKQGVWPKENEEWPYSSIHVSSYEDALTAFHCMQRLLEESNSEKQDKILIESLEKKMPLLDSMVAELLSKSPIELHTSARSIISRNAGSPQKKNDLFAPVESVDLKSFEKETKHKIGSVEAKPSSGTPNTSVSSGDSWSRWFAEEVSIKWKIFILVVLPLLFGGFFLFRILHRKG